MTADVATGDAAWTARSDPTLKPANLNLKPEQALAGVGREHLRDAGRPAAARALINTATVIQGSPLCGDASASRLHSLDDGDKVRLLSCRQLMCELSGAGAGTGGS